MLKNTIISYKARKEKDSVAGQKTMKTARTLMKIEYKEIQTHLI